MSAIFSSFLQSQSSNFAHYGGRRMVYFVVYEVWYLLGYDTGITTSPSSIPEREKQVG